MDEQQSAEPLDIAKQYIAENYPHMIDGNFSVTEHNPQHDLHLADHLDDVNESHFDTEKYSVVTSQKQIDIGNNVTIPYILKFKVKDGQVDGVLGSKSFDDRQVPN
jgi:hypothetical protein